MGCVVVGVDNKMRKFFICDRKFERVEKGGDFLRDCGSRTLDWASAAYDM